MQEGDIVKMDMLVKYSGNRKSKTAWGRIKKFLRNLANFQQQRLKAPLALRQGKGSAEQQPTTGYKSKPQADITPWRCKGCGIMHAFYIGKCLNCNTKRSA